jgi:hypothetical protein
MNRKKDMFSKTVERKEVEDNKKLVQKRSVNVRKRSIGSDGSKEGIKQDS